MTTTDQQTHAAPDTDAADVEAVARAICERCGHGGSQHGHWICPDFPRSCAVIKCFATPLAEAAIAAYQARLADTGRAVVPVVATEAMANAGAVRITREYAESDWETAKDMAERLNERQVWSAMIDEALK